MINKDEIIKIANLARLSFTEDKINKFSAELSNIEKMISSMVELNCDSVEPLTSVNDNNIKLRKDIAISQDITDQLFKNAPGYDANLSREVKCFIVPKVVE